MTFLSRDDLLVLDELKDESSEEDIMSHVRPLMRPGRKRKAESFENVDKQSMKLLRAARNRESAQASRERKRLYQVTLEKENKRLREETESLKKKVELIEEQNNLLQTQLKALTETVSSIQQSHNESKKLNSEMFSQDILAKSSNFNRPSDLLGAALVKNRRILLPSKLNRRNLTKLNYVPRLLETLKKATNFWICTCLVLYGNKSSLNKNNSQ